MNAGLLRHRVTVEQLVVDLDSDGAKEETWLPVFDRPISARIVALSGREYIAATAVQSKISTRITVRYRPEFKASMRILHRDTIYNIEAVIPDPDSGIRTITLACSTGVNEG